MSTNSRDKVEGQYQNDEISLRDLLLKIKEFWIELWRFWWFIPIFCIPFLAFSIYQHLSFEKTYKAELTFMVNEDEGSSSLAGMSSVLGSFGLGGVSGGEYNLEKMLSLLKSRKIIQDVLLEKAEIDGKADYYANHIIFEQDLHEDWEDEVNEDIDLSNFKFNNANSSSFTIEDNTALKYIHTQIIGNPEEAIPSMLNSSITEETGIMKISLISKNEKLSINLLESLYENLSEFYVNKTIEKQLNTFNLVESKADSLLTELRNAEYSLANFMDKNRGLYNRKDQLEQFRLEAKVKMLGAAYTKVIEQKEIAEFSLNDQTPVVQIIDYPLSPIKPEKSPFFKNLIIACFLGGFLASIFIIGRKIINDALQ